MMTSLKLAKPSCNEKGSILVIGLLALSLGLLVAFGSFKLVNQSQAKVAMQSRLDICAVRLASGREHFLRQMAITNYYVKWTIYIVNTSRILKVVGVLFPPLEVAAGASEAVAVQANQVITVFQDGLALERTALEMKNLYCSKTPFSQELAGCLISPLITGSTKREKPIFPDLKGELRWTNQHLGKVQCHDKSIRGHLQTNLAINGDTKLVEKEFTDVFEK